MSLSILEEIRSAQRELARMQGDPRPLVRRLVVVPGYRAHKRMGKALANTLRGVVTEPGWIIEQHHTSSHSFEHAGARVLHAIGEAWGREEPIDFVGVSMGGLLGRWLAMPEHAGLPIERLFTISTPHRGANAAKIATFDDSARAMIPGSERLAELDGALADAEYTMRCYARTRDWWVGTGRLAPVGYAPITVRTPLWEPAHFMSSYDVRTLVDIARHVRGEEPWLID